MTATECSKNSDSIKNCFTVTLGSRLETGEDYTLII